MQKRISAMWGSCGVAVVVLFMMLAVAPSRVFAQSEAERVLQQVERAFGQGDGRQLSEASADRVEITLFGSSTLFSRGQAAYVLSDFFQQYPPRRCDFKEATRTDGSWFAAGQYWYGTTDTPLRVYVGLRERASGWELREIRIEEQTQRK